ncbi:hypothetical protein J4468_02530 [Candidatus Woesearchaeota archaeon]|nr:hypothetical protein [Candidatus Woesearchaeota archaeon]
MVGEVKNQGVFNLVESIICLVALIIKMPKRAIGLRGYLGELIFQQWLEKKYPCVEGFEIIKEIIPEGVSKKGGGYLDFGVVKEEKIIRIYEVKTQDYIFGKDSSVNGALEFIWMNKKRVLSFVDNQNHSYITSKNFEAFLILLVSPNEEGIKIIGEENLAHIILFSELEIERFINIHKLKIVLDTDLESELNSIKNPTQGKRIKPEFFKRRDQINKDCI